MTVSSVYWEQGGAFIRGSPHRNTRNKIRQGPRQPPESWGCERQMTPQAEGTPFHAPTPRALASCTTCCLLGHTSCSVPAVPETWALTHHSGYSSCPAPALQGPSSRVTSYERRAIVRWEAPTGLVQRKVMVRKGSQQQSRFAPGCSQPSRDLHKTQGHRETAGSLGTGDTRPNF